MTQSELQIKASLQILKPASEVFNAIIDPSQMKNYFISEASAPLEGEGKTITWRFPEFDGSFDIRTGKIEKDKYVSFYWNDFDGQELLVEISLVQKGADATLVKVTEGTRKNDAAGINWLQRNTAGWANFLACMKAWLEYGIHLRKGAFDPEDFK